MSNDTDRLTITLTDHVPVNIVKAEWPVIAKAKDDDAQQSGNEPFRTWRLTVRQHADGRTLIYGVYDTAWPNENDRRDGQLLPAGGDMVAAIHTVAEAIRAPEYLARACIADLPAEDA